MTFELSLNSRLRKALFLAAIWLPGLLLASVAVRIAISATLAASTEISTLRRAIALDPANPKPYHRLGLIHSYSLEEGDPSEAVRYLRRATELSPHAARYWLDLTSACEATGDTACANNAIARAVELRPMGPSFRWAAANYYLRTEQLEVAWTQFRRLLEISPGHAPMVFRLTLQASGDPQVILQKVVPPSPDPRLRLAYLDFLSARGMHELAYRLWAETVANTPRFQFHLSRGYLDRLLALGRYEEAIGVWGDLRRLDVVTEARTADPENLVFNGDFEQPLLNAGFDWHSRKPDYLASDFSNRDAYRGSACLRVDFTVRHNAEYEAAYEFVPVASNQNYDLRAYIRSEGITSDSGPCLRVLDPACPRCLKATTDMTLGTTPWHPLNLRFTTGPQTRLIRLSVWRARSRSFPAEITGTFWLDGVSLKPAGAQSNSLALGLAANP